MPEASANPIKATPPPRFDSVQLSRFRAFRNLSIQGLGRVNLITGRNNTGNRLFWKHYAFSPRTLRST